MTNTNSDKGFIYVYIPKNDQPCDKTDPESEKYIFRDQEIHSKYKNVISSFAIVNYYLKLKGKTKKM